MSNTTAEVFADPQHGPGVTVTVDGVRVSVYLFGETGIVTRDEGQHGVEVTGPWVKFREQARELYREGGSP